MTFAATCSAPPDYFLGAKSALCDSFVLAQREIPRAFFIRKFEKNSLFVDDYDKIHSMQKIISAGIIVFRRTREGIKFLILYHGRNYWNFPKGKVESEERSWQAALREVREETGLKSTELRFVGGFKTYERFMYRRGQDKIFKIVILYLAETRQPRITVSHEHEGYGWFTFSEAKRVLSKHHESVNILQRANDFLHKASLRRGQKNPPRPDLVLQGGSLPSRTT